MLLSQFGPLVSMAFLPSHTTVYRRGEAPFIAARRLAAFVFAMSVRSRSVQRGVDGGVGLPALQPHSHNEHLRLIVL